MKTKKVPVNPIAIAVFAFVLGAIAITTFYAQFTTSTSSSASVTSTAAYLKSSYLKVFRTYTKTAEGKYFEFYSASPEEGQAAVQQHGFSRTEDILGRIFIGQVPRTFPLYRLTEPASQSKFYTGSEEEKQNAIDNLRFKYDGVVGFIFLYPETGTIPVTRLRKDNVYYVLSTSNAHTNRLRKEGYTVDGIVGYIFPATTPAR